MNPRYLIIASLIITITPFLLLSLFYKQIPSRIPVFVDMKGDPSMMLNKQPLTVFRLPLMGVMIQIICFAMYSLKLEKIQKKNSKVWVVVALLAALKMAATSMEVLIYTNEDVLSIIRSFALAMIGIAVLIILVNAYMLYKNHGKQFFHYFRISIPQKIIIVIAAIGYLFLAGYPIVHL